MKAVLDEFRMFPGLSVHWILFGPSGRADRPATGGVLRHYTRCRKSSNLNVKTIANSFFVANIGTHPHGVKYRCDAARVGRLAMACGGECPRSEQHRTSSAVPARACRPTLLRG